MRPGHIQVFDGLRITTEHIDHLQGSFHTALQDIREILGLGHVYYGFEVVAEGEQRITVQPGLAFDFQKNRIVCDEPKTLEVTFEPEEDTKYICIQYDQVEDGQIEEQFTLIWDGCSVVLRATLPKPEENLIPIAKLNRVTGGETAFEVISLLAPEQHEKPEEGAATEEEELQEEESEGEEASTEPETFVEEEESQEEEVLEETEGSETSAEPETPVEVEGSNELPTEDEVSAEEGEASVEVAEESLSTKSEFWRLRIQQGVVRLAADPEKGHSLSTLLLEPLKQKLSSGTSADNKTLGFTLAENEVALDFPVFSLTCHTIISAAFDMAEDSTSTEAPGSEEEIPLHANLRFQTTAQGEATFSDETVSQFGLSTIQFQSGSEPGGMPWQIPELTEQGIALLAPGVLLKNMKNENSGSTSDMLQHLQVLVGVDQRDTLGFQVTCKLLWKGEITEEIIQNIKTQTLEFTWEALVAWKALGESQQ